MIKQEAWEDGKDGSGNTPMTSQRETEIEREEFGKFVRVMVWIAIVIISIGLTVQFARDIYRHGVEDGFHARTEQEKEEFFKRNLCIDWEHANAANRRMAKEARKMR